MKKIATIAALLLAALAGYLLLWPVPVDPVAWPAPPVPGYQGPHAPNQRLAGLTLIPLGILLQTVVLPAYVFLGLWFLLQFVMLAVAALGKEFLRWQRDGRSTHIFNPSAFGLCPIQGRLICAEYAEKPIQRVDVTVGIF